jgi:hypothetical protein
LLSPEQPSLTPDARHLIYVTNTTGRKVFRYLSRAEISQPFGNPVDFNPFFGNPDIFWPFLTGDCARLYLIVSSENLFYVKQR